MERKISKYSELAGMTREQIIQIAGQEIKRTLTEVDLSQYRDVRVWKTSKYLRVKFDANISVHEQEIYSESLGHSRSPQIGSSITYIVSETKVEVRPNESKFLFKYTSDIFAIAKTFDVRDSLSFEDQGENFRVRTSHPSTSKSSGGSEVYLINKKTLERDMIQHEHPHSFGGEGVITDRFGNTYVDPDPEIEMLDPAFALDGIDTSDEN